jgi:hypothetical protein
VHAKFSLVDLRGKGYLEKVNGAGGGGVDNNNKMDLKVIGGEAWTGLIWLRIGRGGRRL